MKFNILVLLAVVLLYQLANADKSIANDLSDKYSISLNDNANLDLTLLKATLEDAIRAFESNVATLNAKLNVSVGPKGCLRAGYDVTSKEIVFCNTKNVKNFGLDSKDVILHESFHAMLCNVRPDVCSSSAFAEVEKVAVHEALADFFSYHISPDECFGENFYKDRQCVRNYRTSMCYSLIDGAHAKGSTIVTYLLNENKMLSGLKQVLLYSEFNLTGVLQRFSLSDNSCFSANQAPALTYKVKNRETSKLNKYWLIDGETLELEFIANLVLTEKFSNFSINWLTVDGKQSVLFNISAGSDPLSFKFLPNQPKGIEKLMLQIWNDSELIGSIPFYMGIKEKL